MAWCSLSRSPKAPAPSEEGLVSLEGRVRMLRTTYQEIMECLSVEHVFTIDSVIQKLQTLADSANVMLQRYNPASSYYAEIKLLSYLSKKQTVLLGMDHSASAERASHQLLQVSLDALSQLEELEARDPELVVRTAILLYELGDIWAHKQLLAHFSDSLTAFRSGELRVQEAMLLRYRFDKVDAGVGDPSHSSRYVLTRCTVPDLSTLLEKLLDILSIADLSPHSLHELLVSLANNRPPAPTQLHPSCASADGVGTRSARKGGLSEDCSDEGGRQVLPTLFLHEVQEFVDGLEDTSAAFATFLSYLPLSLQLVLAEGENPSEAAGRQHAQKTFEGEADATATLVIQIEARISSFFKSLSLLDLRSCPFASLRTFWIDLHILLSFLLGLCIKDGEPPCPFPPSLSLQALSLVFVFACQSLEKLGGEGMGGQDDAVVLLGEVSLSVLLGDPLTTCLPSRSSMACRETLARVATQITSHGGHAHGVDEAGCGGEASFLQIRRAWLALQLCREGEGGNASAWGALLLQELEKEGGRRELYLSHLAPSLATINKGTVLAVLATRGVSDMVGERVCETGQQEESDLAALVVSFLSRSGTRVAEADAWRVLGECEAWGDPQHGVPCLQRVIQNAVELQGSADLANALPEVLSLLSAVLSRWPRLLLLCEEIGTQLLSLSVGCVVASRPRCSTTVIQLLHTLLEVLGRPLHGHLVCSIFALLVFPGVLEVVNNTHAELLQLCNSLICARDQDALALLADSTTRSALMRYSLQSTISQYHTHPSLSNASCSLLAKLLVLEVISGGNEGEDALSALCALHRTMTLLPYVVQDADFMFIALLPRIPASPRSRDMLFSLLAQLLYVLHLCPLSVLPDWLLPPLCPLELLSEQRALEVLQVLEFCMRCECFPRQSLRDAFAWLAGLPLLANPPQISLQNVTLNAHFALTGMLPSHPTAPLSSCLPITLPEIQPPRLLWRVFGHLVELGVGAGQRCQQTLGGSGGLMQNMDYQNLLTSHNYLAVLQQDDLASAALHVAARCAVVHVLCYPSCLSSWGALLARASEAHSILLDHQASKALPEPTCVFFDTALAACSTSTEAGIRGAPLDALLWPLGPAGLRVSLTIVELAFTWMSTQASNELELWFGESRAQDCFLEQLTGTKNVGPVFSDADSFIRALLLQHVLLRMLQHLLRCIFLLLYAHQEQLERGKWLKALQLYAVHLNVLRRHVDKSGTRYLCQQEDLLSLYSIENYWQEHPFSLMMAAKLRFKVRQDVGESLILARRAQSETTRSGGCYAKPEKLAVLYHASSLRLRIALSFFEGLEWVVNQVVALACSQGCSGQQLAEAFLVLSLVDLHICLQRDAFHFQARTRLAQAVSQLLSLSSPPLILPWKSEELKSHYKVAQTTAAVWLPAKPTLLENVPLFFEALTVQEEFRYLHRLFEKRRPQVLAMWVVDNPVTLWDQVLGRLVVFDHLRRKYVQRYLGVAAQTGNGCAEVFSLANNALDCAIYSATVHWMVAKAVSKILNHTLSCHPDGFLADLNVFTLYCERVHGLYVRLGKRKMGPLACDLQRVLSLLVDVYIDGIGGENGDAHELRTVLAADGDVEGEGGMSSSIGFNLRWGRFLSALQVTNKKRKAMDAVAETLTNKVARLPSKEAVERQEDA